MLRWITPALLALAAAAPGQAVFDRFGVGCPNGVGTAVLTSNSRPVLGTILLIHASPVPTGLGVLAFGASRTADAAGPLPRLLHPLAPGCVQWISLDVLEPALALSHHGTWFGTVPHDPAFLGASLYCQHLHSGTNPLGVAVSDGARLVIGTPASRFTAATWNIHHGEGLDARIDLPRLAAALSRAGVDFVGLQEVDRNVARSNVVDQTAELARLLGFSFHAFGRSIDIGSGQYGNAILSRWPITSVRVHGLPNPLGREARTVLDATIALPYGRSLRALVTHFDHGSDPITRQLSAATVVGLLGSPTEPALLLGDLNAQPGSGTLQRLGGAFTDASANSPALTFRADRPTVRIDYALLSPAARFDVASSTVPVEPVASDHRPVVVVLDLY